MIEAVVCVRTDRNRDTHINIIHWIEDSIDFLLIPTFTPKVEVEEEEGEKTDASNHSIL